MNFELVSRSFELVSRSFELVSSFELVPRSFELVSGSFELVSSPRSKFLCVTLGKESDHTKADWWLFAELMCVSYLEWVSYQGDPARWRH